jgi:hypothetical protein
VETGFEEERGWNPLGNTKKRRGVPNRLGIALSTGRRRVGEEKSPSAQSRTGQWNLYPGAPDLSGEGTRLVLYGTNLSSENRIFRLGTCSEKLAIYNLVDRP